MTDPITYAKAGGPPDNWLGLQVRDLDTGKVLDRVLEANTVQGWVVEHSWGPPPASEVVRTRREGRFAIELQPE